MIGLSDATVFTGTAHIKGDIGVGGVSLAVEGVCIQPVSTRLLRGRQGYITFPRVSYFYGYLVGYGFNVAADFALPALLHHFPRIVEGINFRVARLNFRGIRLAGLQPDILVGGFPVQPHARQARTAPSGPRARPEILHHVNRSRFLTTLEEHAIPGRSPFLFLSPEKNV